MKKLSMLLTAVFTLVIVSGAFAQTFDAFDGQEQDSFSLSVTFGSGDWSLVATLLAPDNDSPLDFNAGGSDRKIIAKAQIAAEAGGLYELVTYTNNLGIDLQNIVLPAEYPNDLLDNDTNQNWIGAQGGLVYAIGTEDELHLPVKIRSEAVAGEEPRLVGDALLVADFEDPIAAKYVYVPEILAEAVAGGAPQIIASTALGSTADIIADLDLAFAVNEGLAADFEYSATIYFDMRHN